MGYLKYVNRLLYIDELIRKRSTGSPSQLANRLDISVRMVYEIIKELREDLQAPISYDHANGTYYYEREFRMSFSDKQSA